jgi:hypothetical protein
MPIRPRRFCEALQIMPNSAQNSMPNNSQSDTPRVSLSKLLEVKFSTLFDVGLRLSEGLSECVGNFTSNSVEIDKRTS